MRGWNAIEFGRTPLRELIAHYRHTPVTIREPAVLIRMNRHYSPTMTPTELYDATRARRDIEETEVEGAAGVAGGCSFDTALPISILMASALLAPPRLWPREEVLSTACVPRAAGVYAWYFKAAPALVPLKSCIAHDGLTLLYVGISPKAPPTKGRAPSSQTLWRRIRYHFRGNAYGSTLRLTLGCLLSEELAIELRRVGSGERLTFADGEHVLSEWMAKNAFVCWLETPSPWLVESQLIAETSVPLNLADNRNHSFHQTLSAARRHAKERALALPIWRVTDAQQVQE
jgi:GIY-YIG catalytic domain